jgi:histidine ammonia-lyase
MGTIAARDCLRVLALTEQVAAALSLAVRQGMEFRLRQGNGGKRQLAPAVRKFQEALAAEVPFLDQDRALEPELRRLMELIRGRHWALYA